MMVYGPFVIRHCSREQWQRDAGWRKVLRILLKGATATNSRRYWRRVLQTDPRLANIVKNRVKKSASESASESVVNRYLTGF